MDILTHHQTQSVTMLQPILMVAPPAHLQEMHFHSTSPVSLCSSLPAPGTNSTNAVGGSGGLSQSQGGSQCLSAPQQRKGTFTDDLHKLVDNWARDAMNLSQVEDHNSIEQLTSSSNRVQMFQFFVFIRGSGAPNSCSRPRRRDTATK